MVLRSRRRSSATCTSDLHCIDLLIVARVLEVILVHTSGASKNVAIRQQNLVNASPSCISIVPVANLEFVIQRLAAKIIVRRRCRQSQCVGRAIVPLINSLIKIVVPARIRGADNLQG